MTTSNSQSQPPAEPSVAQREERAVEARREPSDPDEKRPGGFVGLIALVGLLVLLGVSGGVPLLIVVLGIIVMIFLHELGHYLTAKSAGMKVTEFFLGFGPRLWSFRRGETEYGIKAIPAGAYVKIVGMNNLEEVDPADEDRTYRQKPYWRRLSVAFAGSGMHFLLALGLLWGLFTFVGFYELDEEPDWQVASLTENSSAEDFGILPGDVITDIDGIRVESWNDVGTIIPDLGGETVTMTVLRDGEVLRLDGTIGRQGERTDPDRPPPQAVDPDAGFLGVGRELLPAPTVDPVTGLGKSFETFGDLTVESTKALGRFFSPDGLGSFFRNVFGVDDENVAVSGDDQPAVPGGSESGGTSVDSGDDRVLSILGAARLGGDLADEGIEALLAFFVLLNVFIGLFNLIPVLPLDGGHVAIATYERIRSRSGERYHADVAKMLPIAYAVVFVLISVGLGAIYLDIVDPVSLSG